MRDDVTFNSTLRKYAKGYYIPLPKQERDLLCINPGDDIEVRLVVRQRFPQEDKAKDGE